MIIEYSQEERGKVFAYRFAAWERAYIANGLRPYIPRLEKKIQRIIDDPENEGQVTYREQIRELRHEITALREIIDEFSITTTAHSSLINHK